MKAKERGAGLNWQDGIVRLVGMRTAVVLWVVLYVGCCVRGKAGRESSRGLGGSR